MPTATRRLPDLPWDVVNARDARDVLRELGRSPATAGGRPLEGGRKFACLWCASSDALHAYPKGGVHCFACSRHASNVDAAAHLYGLQPADALRQLAPRLGIYVPDDRDGLVEGKARASADRPAARPAPPPVKADPLDELRAAGMVPALSPAVYAAALETLALPDVGAAYLEGRGFPADQAHDYGFRALEDAAGWGRLWDALADSFDPLELEAAGFPARGRLPWGGKVPALVIPYAHRGAVVALRFRRLDHSKETRYQTLPGASLPVPFNADALDAGGELHVVEGELNAYALHAHGVHAVGLAGAHGWRAEWTPAVARAALLVAWYDDDAAGAKGRAKLARVLVEELGMEWLDARGRRCTVPAGLGDVADLHRAGKLAGLVAAARWRSAQ